MKSPHGLRLALRERGILAALRPLTREFRIAYYRWALREINPQHPDVPAIVMRLRGLLDERGPAPVRAAWEWL